MTIRFTNTVEDVVAWNIYRLFHTPAGRNDRKLDRFSIGLVLVAWLVGSSLFLWQVSAPWGIVTVAEISASVLVGYALLVGSHAAFTTRSSMTHTTRRLIHKGRFPYIKGEIAVTPRPDGWFSIWPDGELLRKWEAMASVSEKDGGLLLHWSENEFSLLPAHAFASVEERQAFLAEIERYREAKVMAESTPAPVAAQWYRDRNQVESEGQTVRSGVNGAP